MDRVVQVVKLDERSKYTTMWPVGKIELGGRVYWDLVKDDGNKSPN